MRHTIKKQVIQITAMRHEDIYSIQQAASEYFYRTILPALEEMFNELTGEEELLSIEKMEIDLGFIQWHQQQKNISIANLQGVLRQQIRKKLEIPQAGFQSQHLSPFTAKPNATKIPLRLHAADQWMYYMENGVLPWGLFQVSPDWQTKVLETFATTSIYANRLRRLIQTSPKALARIQREHDSDFLIQLTGILTAKAHTQLDEWIPELQSINLIIYSSESKPLSAIHNPEPSVLWRTILKAAARAESGTSTETLAKNVLIEWLEQNPVTYDTYREIKKLARLTAAILDEEQIVRHIVDQPANRDLTKKSNPKKLNAKSPKKNNREDSPEESSARDTRKNTGQKAEIGVPPSATSETQNKDTNLSVFSPSEIPKEGLFVAHAGLVLIHPFLRFLFKNTALFKEGIFQSTAAKEQAVMLVHYLATGTLRGEEHLLAIPKIICGWPLDTPLQEYRKLQAIEQQEADDLLNAAISQWSILKNTSIEGLRESFLQRNGKVQTRSNGIYIQVEKASIDVLLDHLPWNLGLIKLPWLNELIHVEWR